MIKSVPFNLVDSNAEIESLYASAVMGILSLSKGRFSRPEIFSLMMNPCFMSKWNITTEEIQIFASWTDSLNIFHTFSKEEKEKKGYSKNQAYTWKQGLLRLRMSKIMSLSGNESGKNGYKKEKTGAIKSENCYFVDSF